MWDLSLAPSTLLVVKDLLYFVHQHRRSLASLALLQVRDVQLGSQVYAFLLFDSLRLPEVS